MSLLGGQACELHLCRVWLNEDDWHRRQGEKGICRRDGGENQSHPSTVQVLWALVQIRDKRETKSHSYELEGEQIQTRFKKKIKKKNGRNTSTIAEKQHHAEANCIEPNLSNLLPCNHSWNCEHQTSLNAALCGTKGSRLATDSNLPTKGRQQAFVTLSPHTLVHSQLLLVAVHYICFPFSKGILFFLSNDARVISTS